MKNIYAALVKAQSKIPTIEKDKTANAGTYTYKYVSYSSITEAIKEPLEENGLAHFSIRSKDAEGIDRLVTILIHESGEQIEHSQPVPNFTKPQDYGAWLTYMRRYQLSALLGLAADEDVDAKEVETVESNTLGISDVIWYIREEIELEINSEIFLPHITKDKNITNIALFPANQLTKLQNAIEQVKTQKARDAKTLSNAGKSSDAN